MTDILIPLEPPYSDKFDRAYLSINPKTNRKYVHLHNTTNLKSSGTTYARYIYQIKYWKEHGKWIPEGYHVDHINNDCTDDRIENYQLLTPKQNNIKRDEVTYRQKPLDPITIQQIENYLENNKSYAFIADTFNITRGHLRYIVRQYLPHLDQYFIINMNIDEIKQLLDGEVSQYVIADRYGVDQATICRYIADKLPDYTQEAILKRKLSIIKECLSKKESVRKIAKKLKCHDSNISYYISIYFPEYRIEVNKQKEIKKLDLVEKIKELLEGNFNQDKISKILNITPAVVHSLIKKHLPEYLFFNAYDLRVKKIGEMIFLGKSKQEMADELNTEIKTINRIIVTHYPEKTRNEKYADKLIQFKELVQSDKHTLPQISNMLEVGYVTICQWLKIYFPEKHSSYRTEENKKKILDHHNLHPELSNLDLSIQTELPYFFVVTVIRQ